VNETKNLLRFIPLLHQKNAHIPALLRGATKTHRKLHPFRQTAAFCQALCSRGKPWRLSGTTFGRCKLRLLVRGSVPLVTRPS
jgi:hypothetical protein